jgi:hypothetical protein
LKFIEQVRLLLGEMGCYCRERLETPAAGLGFSKKSEVRLASDPLHANRADDNHPGQDENPMMGLQTIDEIQEISLKLRHATNLGSVARSEGESPTDVPGRRAAPVVCLAPARGVCQSSLGHNRGP